MKIFSIFLVPIFLFVFAKFTFAAVAPDLNNDGRVDRGDFDIIVRDFLGSYTIFDYNKIVTYYGQPWGQTTPVATSGNSNGLVAFPGAEGFGALSKGGRGGTVIRVTNLNDTGPGSLRACIQASGPRYCIFDTSGNVTLNSQLDIVNPYITIAGESAPSPGITLKNQTVSVKTHNVIIRHLRIRVGDATSGDKDALKFNEATTNNVIADHISASWAIDENVSTWNSGVRDITISNSIISEALHNSVHTEGPHSKGLFVGDMTKNISLINILAAHNDDRNFLVKGGGSTESINNLFYNWQEPDATEIGDNGIATVIGNVYIKGPNTSAAAKGISKYASGTLYSFDIRNIGLTGTNAVPNSSTKPVDSGRTSPNASAEVENMLYATAGARPRDRDTVDSRVVNEVRTRTGRIIDSPSQVGGFLNLAVNTRTFPVPANYNGDDDSDGYTNLEELLHQHADALD